MRAIIAAVCGTLAIMVAGCERTPSADVSAEWPFHGGSQQEQRYSPLAEINRETVGGLGLAWYHEFENDRGQEATPIVSDGVIYVSTGWAEIHAFDAETGKPLWRYDPEVPRSALVNACCDAVNRGVAVSGGKVFVGTLDGRLVAVDAKTGKLAWSVNTLEGQPAGMRYTITGAPRVVKDKIVIGNAGAEMGVRGFVTAFDAATGKLAWRFYLTPNPDGKPDGAASDDVLLSKAGATWSDGEWKQSGGGGTAWDSMMFDPEANLLYIGAGNGSPFDWYRRSGGKGDNLFLSSIVAVDPDTGRYAWHYQTTPQDAWDYTATQQIISATLTIEGKPRDVVMQAPKNGFFYVLDKRTGDLISARPFAPVTWAKGIDPKTGRPILAENAHYNNGPALLQPGPFGAHSWQSMSYSPRTGLVYIPVQLMMGEYERAADFKRRPLGQNVALAMKEFPEDQLDAIRAATKGQLLAWDPVAQKARWSVEHPWFLNGGTLATAGDLVFQGNADGKFVAYDANDGKVLWSYEADHGIIAAPVSYGIKGTQYVAVMVGIGGAGSLIGKLVPDRPRMSGRLMVFKLGAKTAASAYQPVYREKLDLAGVTSTGDADAGMAEYNKTCGVCHGANASVAYTADLRRSGALADAGLWKDIVLDGVLSDTGMVGFKDILTPREAENIRAYVLRQALKEQAAAK